VKEQFTNQIGPVVSYAGQNPPVVVTPQLVQPEIFQHLYALWQKAFEIAGVSQMQVAGQKPPGLSSGEALRTLNDIGADRFMTIAQAYENTFLDLARISIALVKDAVGSGSYKVRVPVHGDLVREIDWKDVNLDEDQYVMKVFPVSSLPTEPAGRMETVQEWVQAGWITPRQGKRLIDFPDLEMAETLSDAAQNWLDLLMEKFVDEEDFYQGPEEFDDLQLARETALEHYQRGKVDSVPDKIMDKFRRFLAEIGALEASAASAQAAPIAGLPAPGSGVPQAQAVLPPKSDLLPFKAAAAA
jgi:hypothetical protein